MTKLSYSNRLRYRLGYTIPSSFLSVRLALLLLLSVLLTGIIGFMWIDQYSLLDAFYMTVITLSTVGFTEVHPLSDGARLFTAILILISVGVIAYVLAVFSYYIVQGEIFKNMHGNLIRKSIDQLNDHSIICGYGRFGQEIAAHLSAQNIPFVIIEQDNERIENIQKSPNSLLYVHDDATHDEALIQAGIYRAKAVISALPDDSDNVFIAFSARQLNPKLRIISRASRIKTQKKLLKAGASYVVVPEQIGGFYMATLVNKPGAVEFFYFIINEYEHDIGFEEFSFSDLPELLQGRTIGEMKVRELTGANIIGYRDPNGRYTVNPGPNVALEPGASFIALGDHLQMDKLRNYIKTNKK